MPYGCRVVACDGLRVDLEVVPEQPDCDPLYTSARFALGLLVGEGDNALGRALGDAVEAMTGGTLPAADAYVAALRVTIATPGSSGAGPAPVARYAIEVTDATWIAHMRVGAAFDSNAWSDDAGEPKLDAG